ncbi:FAD-binding oxidoreductase [bacterium]|nr:FAD-binding oxidoreductase [bacterium]
MKIDYLIIGQGLAGSLLSLALIEKGYQVMVIDDNHQSAATKFAAGVINPITGKRLVRTWNNDTHHDQSISHYIELEKQFKTKCLHNHALVRFLRSDIEKDAFSKKQTDPNYSAHLNQIIQPKQFTDHFTDAETGFVLPSVYQLDTPTFLKSAKQKLIANNAYLNTTFQYSDILEKDTYIQYGEITAQSIIFCEGYKSVSNPWFHHLPFENAKGEILTVKCTTLPSNTIFNNGKWLCPTSSPGTYRYGTTSYWEFQNNNPEEAGTTLLKESLSKWIKHPTQIDRIDAGVRPILKNRRPIYGFHPNHPRIGLINGLGGQGTLLAPLVIQAFTKALETDSNIPLTELPSIKG